MIKNLSILKKNPNAKVRSIEGKYYLFGLGQCFELNELGAIVLKYIGKEMEVDAFCELISNKYDQKNTEIIKKDIIKYIDFLIETKMVEING